MPNTLPRRLLIIIPQIRARIAELLPRPIDRPGKKLLVEYKGFLYQAESWKTARRVVAKVEHHPGELFPCVAFIVTNLTLPSRALVRFYRGTAEQWIKEGATGSKATAAKIHLAALLRLVYILRGGGEYKANGHLRISDEAQFCSGSGMR